jgi:hypothetical protein
MKFYVFLPLLFLSISCSEIGKAPKRVFTFSGSTIDLSTEIEGDWDKVCLFTPYSSNQEAERLIGFEFDIESKSNIYELDSITLFLVVKRRQVIDYFEVPRNSIDFSAREADCYPREKAWFNIVTDSAGGYKI